MVFNVLEPLDPVLVCYKDYSGLSPEKLTMRVDILRQPYYHHYHTPLSLFDHLSLCSSGCPGMSSYVT